MRSTSKSLSGLKLAVAALVVAGVVGMAWAAEPAGIAGPYATATFSTEVNFVSSIDWVVQEDVTLDKFGSIDVVGPIGGSGGDLVTNPGNVGILKVKTNATHWDIKMTSANNGKPYTPGDSIWSYGPQPCTQNWDCTDSVKVPGIGNNLKYKSTLASLPSTGAVESIDGSAAPYDVILDVAVGGAVQNPVNKNYYSIGCGPTTGCGDAPLPVRLTKAKVKDSKNTPVSFASAIGSVTTDTKFNGLTIGGVQISAVGTDMAQIASNGFNGTGEDQYIYVNAGIHPSNTQYLPSLSPTTVYKETLTFTLYNGF